MAKNILLVEDDTLLSEMYLMALEDGDITVSLVKDGRKAIEFDINNVDLVLLDVRIPEVDGLEVLKNYRKRGFKKPIVIITNSPQVNMAEAKALGADGFLVKSHTDVSEMLNAVQSYLS